VQSAMSYQVLSRKWRPKKFQDVIGQQHITQALSQAIQRGTIGHAYLMAGTRGIGKTSVARILARALRCENISQDGNPCLECGPCLELEDGSVSMNVIEVDGASCNKVEDIREIVSNVHYLPTTGRYKIYIIDEVHMLSVSAFNALLKTLEEPPAHVVFIFATTEPGKLLGTILSRCQRLDFRNASTGDVVDHLKKILKSEGITYQNDNSLSQIARLGNGSFRDSLSLLDQVLSYVSDKIITDEAVSYALGLAKTSSIRNIISSLLRGDDRNVCNTYQALLRENVELEGFVHSLLNSLYRIIDHIDDESLLVKEEVIDKGVLDDISVAELYWIYEVLLKDYTWIKETIDADRAFELLLRKLSLRRDFLSSRNIPEKKKTLNHEKSVEIKEPVEQVEKSKEIPVVAAGPIESLEKEEGDWIKFLTYLHGISPATASNLEQGNLTENLFLHEEELTVNLGFSKEAEVFYDHINEEEVLNKVKGHLSDFFKIERECIKLEMVKLSTEEKEEKDFKSRAQILTERKEEDDELKKSNLENDPIIKKAEELFGSKVDKVVINK